MNRFMGRGHPVVGTDVQSACDSSAGRFSQVHVAGSFKGLHDLDPEIHVHREVSGRRVMVEKHVVAIRAQTRVLAEERPHAIQGRLPGRADLPDPYLSSNRCKHARSYELQRNIYAHKKFSKSGLPG